MFFLPVFTTFANEIPLSGQIVDLEGNPMENVLIQVNQGVHETYTDSEGRYEFSLAEGENYYIRPISNDNPTLGVTTYDIIVAMRHILGVASIQNPFQLIAADVNNSQSVTTMDVIAMRKLILQMEDSFPNNSSWRFVDAMHSFEVGPNPFVFPEGILLSNYSDITEEANFIGVKVGDINISLDSNSLGTYAERNTRNIKLEDQPLMAGESVQIPVEISSQFEGFQLALNWDENALELDEITHDPSRLDLMYNQKELGKVFLNAWGQDLNTKESTCFHLRFRALKKTKLSEVLFIDDSDIPSELYEGTETNPIALYFSNANFTPIEHEVFPNPFSASTQLSFRLQGDTRVEVRIFDSRGFLVYQTKGSYAVGDHSITINDITTRGVLTYQILTDNGIEKGRLLRY